MVRPDLSLRRGNVLLNSDWLDASTGVWGFEKSQIRRGGLLRLKRGRDKCRH
jgi:hypothetical protein